MKRSIGPVITAILAVALVGLLAFGLSKQGTSRALDAALAAGREPGRQHGRAPAGARRGRSALGVARALARRGRRRQLLGILARHLQRRGTAAQRAQRMLVSARAGTVIGITYKDITSNAVAKIREFHLSYPNLRDIDGSFAAAYGTAQLPETFVLNRRLHVVAIARGEITSSHWLTAAIRRAELA